MMRTTPARLGRIAFTALALGGAPGAADGVACDASLTGTWADTGSRRVQIVEADGSVSVRVYTLDPHGRRNAISLSGTRAGDRVIATYSFLQFPAGLMIAVASCDALEARWFTAQQGGVTGDSFELRRRSNGYCGDGVVGLEEECDDGNLDDRDACTDVCLLPRCGDDVRDPREACDDGNANDRDGCSATCRRELPGAPQSCPDLSGTWRVTDDDRGFAGSWTIRHARDGTIEAVVFAPSARDLVASRVAFTGRERNGRIELVGLVRYFERELEVRFAGSALGCERLELQRVGVGDRDVAPPLYVLDRVSRSFCGDGLVDAGERCDDGNLLPGDGCSFACTLPMCGDGLVDPDEDCDPGDFVRDPTCESCTRDPAPCSDLTGTWRGGGTILLDRPRDVQGLHLSLVDDGRGGLRGAVAGDAIGLRREIWLAIEGAHAGADIRLGTSVRTTTALPSPPDGLSTVLAGSLDGCDRFAIGDAVFSRISTDVCGDGLRSAVERCDDGNTASGDGCSASCTGESPRRGDRPTVPRLGVR